MPEFLLPDQFNHPAQLNRGIALGTALLLLCSAPLYSQDEPDISKLSGKEVYTSFCSRCHGEDGRGQIPEDMLENMDAPPPDLTDGYFSSREKRKDWEAVVAGGGGVRGLSMSMPAWDGALTPQQITEVVEHMKSFVDQSRFPQGETNFIRAHQVTKAFVEQEFLIIPTVTTWSDLTETQTVLYYADRFGDRWQHEVKLPLVVHSEPLSTKKGIGDLELGFKYCAYDDFEAKEILSFGFEFGIPTGSSSLGFAGNSTSASVFVAAGKGIGSIAQVQGSFKFESLLSHPIASYATRASLSATALFSDSKHGLFPGIEVIHVYEHVTRDAAIFLLPKLYWGITLKGHLAISVGPELQVSGTKQYDTRWRMFFLWDYVDGGLWW